MNDLSAPNAGVRITKTWDVTICVETPNMSKAGVIDLLKTHLNRGTGIWVHTPKQGAAKPRVKLIRVERD